MNSSKVIFYSIMNRDYSDVVLSKFPIDIVDDDIQKTVLKSLIKYKNEVGPLNIGVFNMIIDKLKSIKDDERYESIREKINRYRDEKLDEVDIRVILEDTLKYIREKLLKKALTELIMYQKNGNIDDNIYSYIERLNDASGFTLDETIGHNYKEDYENRLQLYMEQQNEIIKTNLEIINNVLDGGFVKKTLNIFLAPPHTGKCVVGDTKIKVRKRGEDIVREISIEELYRKYRYDS